MKLRNAEVVETSVVAENAPEVVVEQAPIVVGVLTIEEQLAEHKSAVAKLLAMKKELNVKVKELRLAEIESKKANTEHVAKERSLKIKEMIATASYEPKVNKSEVVRNLILQSKTNKEIAEATGYSNKFILDTVWRIEKTMGIR